MRVGPWGGAGQLDCLIRMVVTSLSYSTDLHKFGPFGKENGNHLSLSVAKASFAGFFGRSSKYLDAIGVYLLPR